MMDRLELHLRRITGKDTVLRSYWCNTESGKRYIYNIHDFSPKVIGENPEDYTQIAIEPCEIPIGSTEQLPDGFVLEPKLSCITLERGVLHNSPKDISDCIALLLGKLDDISSMPLQTIGRYMDTLIQTYLSEIAVYQAHNTRVVAQLNTCPTIVVDGIPRPALEKLGTESSGPMVQVEGVTLAYRLGVRSKNVATFGYNAGLGVKIHIAREPNQSKIYALCLLEHSRDCKALETSKVGTTEEVNKIVQELMLFLRDKACLDTFSLTFSVLSNMMTHYQAIKYKRREAKDKVLICYNITNAYQELNLEWKMQQIDDAGSRTVLKLTCNMTLQYSSIPLDVETGAFRWTDGLLYDKEGASIPEGTAKLKTTSAPMQSEIEIELTRDHENYDYSKLREYLRTQLAEKLPLLLTSRRILEKQKGLSVNQDIQSVII